VKRSRTSSTPGVSTHISGSYSSATISAVTNPVGTVFEHSLSASRSLSPVDDYPPEADASNLSKLKTPREYIQRQPLPHYHSDLPQIDRMQASKAFYMDLQDKFIIAGFDEERFSCWCHVEKEKRGEAKHLSLKHTHKIQIQGRNKTRLQRYSSNAFFAHALSCRFFRVSRIVLLLALSSSCHQDPWAITSQGQRLFPNFPLPKPGGSSSGGPEQENTCASRDEESLIGDGSVRYPRYAVRMIPTMLPLTIMSSSESTMSSNHSSAAANGLATRMTEHPEWIRMTHEIATLRQINAELTEKVTTLEAKLERISRRRLDDDASVSSALW
jgi:hypothetical protein